LGEKNADISHLNSIEPVDATIIDMREASRKVRGGKLVKLRFDEGNHRVTIHGDFFLHPEECIFALEDLLSRLPPSSGEDEVVSTVTALLQEQEAQAVGFSARDLASLFKEVVG